MPTISVTTAWNEVRALRAELHRFAAEFGLLNVQTIKVPDAGVGPVRSLLRDEVARVLWALRGRRWDTGTNSWKVNPDTGRRVVVGRPGDLSYLARLVIFLLYTGSTTICAARTRWRGRPDGSATFVDLVTEALEPDDERRAVALSEEDGRFTLGYLHRLGPDAGPGPMAGVPIILCRRLTAHLRRWRDMDLVAPLKRINRLVHPPHAKPCNAKNVRRQDHLPHDLLVREMFQNAGLQGCGLETLSLTAAIWALQAGTTPAKGRHVKAYAQHRAIMRSVAFMGARTYEVFRERFHPFHEDFQSAQAQAMETLSWTVTGDARPTGQDLQRR